MFYENRTHRQNKIKKLQKLTAHSSIVLNFSNILQSPNKISTKNYSGREIFDWLYADIYAESGFISDRETRNSSARRFKTS